MTGSRCCLTKPVVGGGGLSCRCFEGWGATHHRLCTRTITCAHAPSMPSVFPAVWPGSAVPVMCPTQIGAGAWGMLCCAVLCRGQHQGRAVRARPADHWHRRVPGHRCCVCASACCCGRTHAQRYGGERDSVGLCVVWDLCVYCWAPRQRLLSSLPTSVP